MTGYLIVLYKNYHRSELLFFLGNIFGHIMLRVRRED